jgi:nitroimidazol reductase NimA-like FMN-containing flavoprotein (pyridoxamine 5'-phosphate oxidase superfamily)
MRRKEREIVDVTEKLALLGNCKVCRLGLCRDEQPYIVPLNYGYTFENNVLTLYFHGAREGKKMDMIKLNNRACFEIDCEHELLEAEAACGYSFAFASITGFGRIEFIEDTEEKIRALNILMAQQTGKSKEHHYPKAMLDRVCVYKLAVEEFTGKRRSR